MKKDSTLLTKMVKKHWRALTGSHNVSLTLLNTIAKKSNCCIHNVRSEVLRLKNLSYAGK